MTSPIDFLWDTPPHCPTPGCYVHGVPQVEHHVEGCPVFETVASHVHHFGHAADAAGAVLRFNTIPLLAEMDRIRRRAPWRERIGMWLFMRRLRKVLAR